MVRILRMYKKVFAWKYEEMEGLDSALVTHKLCLYPEATPVVQSARTFRAEIELQIKQEVEKLLKAGFIKPIVHPTWLANIVPVRKKNGQIRVCVDFRDLNKACPKDEFTLPNLDNLINATAMNELFSFMDGFSGYNQIRMAIGDAEKTAFRTPLGNFYFTVMPFGLKNAGATYQRAMTAIFHDMLHKNMEDYVDDIVIKSANREHHFQDLTDVFKRCLLYKMRMNPLKCAFGVSAGKFLGFIVHKNGIDLDPTKAASIKKMPAPRNKKQLKSFVGKVSYVRRFIPALAELLAPLQLVIKKDSPFYWDKDQQEAFQKIKATLASPGTMTVPVRGIPLHLYLTSTTNSIGSLLAQEDKGVEKPVYYLSRIVRGAEANYSPHERHCLALVYTAHKLKHYFLSNQVLVMTKSDPIRFILTRQVLTGRLTKWLMILSQFDIKARTPTSIRSQALADLLSQFPSGQYEPLDETLPGGMEDIMMFDREDEWKMSFDGSSTAHGGGAGIVLTSPENRRISLSYKLDFPCTNNEAEYEALAIGLMNALSLGVKNLCVEGDSKLIIEQTKGAFAVKEPKLLAYREIIRKLLKQFCIVEMLYVPRTANKHADALATVASKLDLLQGVETFEIQRKDVPCTVKELLKPEEKGDWRDEIREELLHPQSTAISALQKYFELDGTLFHRSSEGILTKCLGPKEAEEELRRIHGGMCGQEGPPLYRRIQRYGYFWPEMRTEAAKIQRECPSCREPPNTREILVVSDQDWREPYVVYLRDRSLPECKKHAAAVKRRVWKFGLREGQLVRHGYNKQDLVCLTKTAAHIHQ